MGHGGTMEGLKSIRGRPIIQTSISILTELLNLNGLMKTMTPTCTKRKSESKSGREVKTRPVLLTHPWMGEP